MKILVGGDVCPIGRNERLFREPGALAGVKRALSGSDHVIVNLECPLYDRPTPILKGGPTIGAPASTAPGLAEMGVDIAAMGNNHIMDHGVPGLESTLRAVRAAGISTVGAGMNLREASQPLILHSPDADVALIAVAEREYSYATDGRPGACPLDTNLVVRTLRSTPHGTSTVVLVHGGNEHFPFPNPWLQDTCRLMIELGAKAVICQHSHCIGTYEEYQGGLIVYGQGNLLFDMNSRHQSWWQGILVSLDLQGSSLAAYEFIPVIQKPGQEGVVRLGEPESALVLAQMKQRAQVVLNPDGLWAEWRRFCEAQKRNYQNQLFGYGRLRRIANKLFGMADWRPRRGIMNTGNVLRCASHLEALRTLYSLGETTGTSGDGR